MIKDRKRKESGAVEVEATFILPMAILSVILLLYLSLFMCQKANLQAGLETSLVYFKNTMTDAYVTQTVGLTSVLEDSIYKASGNSYAVNGVLNPYEGLFGDPYDMSNDQKFEDYFRTVAGNMLFDDGDDLKISVDYSNGIIYKEMEVTAVQMVEAPIDFSFIGVGNGYEISATARVVVMDSEDMIRNVDYAIDIVEDTKIGEWANNLVESISSTYQKFRKLLGAS